MSKDPQPVVILMAEDDPDDRQMTVEAFAQARLANRLLFVVDGEDLMDYLNQRGRHAAPAASPRPGLILLDLKMPRKNGFEALRDIRSDPQLRPIPVVALTTSSAEEDVLRSYALGINSYIVKPVTFEGFVKAVKTLACYWFQLVELPDERVGK